MPNTEFSLVHTVFARGIDQKSDDFSQDISGLLVGKNVRFRKLGLLEKRYGHRPVTASWFHRQDNNGTSYNLDPFKQDGGRVLGDYRGTLVVSDGYSLGTYIDKPLSNNNTTFLPESFFYADQVSEATVEWRGVASHDSWIVNQDVAYAEGFVAHVYECFSEGTPNGTNTWNSFITVEDYSTRSPVVSHRRITTTAASKLRKPRVAWVGNDRMLIAAFDDNDARTKFYYWTPTLSPQLIGNTGNFISGDTINHDFTSIGGDYAGFVVADATKKIQYYTVFKDGTAIGPLTIYTSVADVTADTPINLTAISVSYNESLKQLSIIWQEQTEAPSFDIYFAVVNVIVPLTPTIAVPATRLYGDPDFAQATVTSCLLLDNQKTVVITSAPTPPINPGHASTIFPSGSGYASLVFSVDYGGNTRGMLKLPWAILASRPFLVDGQNTRIYCAFNAGGARYDTTLNVLVADTTNNGGQIGSYVDTRFPGNVNSAQWTNVLVDLCVNEDFDPPDTGALCLRPVTTALPRQTHPATWGFPYMAPTSIVPVSTSHWLTTTPGTFSNDGRSFVTEIAYDFTPTNTLESSQLGESLEMSGGVPSTFDGHRVAEVGFIYRAEKPGVVYNTDTTVYFWVVADFGSGRGGGIKVAAGVVGQIQYMVIPRYVDKRGEVHRGAPSDPLVITLPFDAGSDRFIGYKLRIPCISLTMRQDTTLPYPQIIWELYRTEVNGTEFYLVNDFNIFLETEFVNKPDAEYIEVFDTRPDTESLVNAGTAFLAPLNAQPVPYTKGNVLPNIHPGCFLAMKTFRNRLLGLGGDRKTCWFSKLYNTGEAIAFTDGFTFSFDETVRVEAIATLDNKAFFFSNREIYKVEGEGPTDTGLQNDYGVPERIASDVGCIDARSVLVGPDAVYFMASPGIYRIDRNLAMSFVGAPVEDFTRDYPVVTSAIMVPEEQLLIWTLSKESLYPNHTPGIRVVFNYLFQTWSHDEIHTLAGESGAMVSQAIWQGRTVMLDEKGVLYFEDKTTNLDLGFWVEFEATTGYLRVAGQQGYQVVRMVGVLAKKESPHSLILEVANDFSDNFHQAWTLTDDILERRSLESFRFRLSRMKCQNLKVRIRDAAPTQGTIGTGKGLSLRGLAFDVMQMPGMVRSTMEK